MLVYKIDNKKYRDSFQEKKKKETYKKGSTWVREGTESNGRDADSGELRHKRRFCREDPRSMPKGLREEP